MGTKIKRSGVARDTDKQLSNGEKLLIWRRRMGWNQAEASCYFNCSIFRYKLAEYDQAKDFKYNDKLKITLKPFEKCLIYRKRSGKTQIEIARKLDMGRFWLRLQETGEVPCDKLLSYWETTTTTYLH